MLEVIVNSQSLEHLKQASDCFTQAYEYEMTLLTPLVF